MGETKFCAEYFRHANYDDTISSSHCKRVPRHTGRHANIGYTELVSDYVIRKNRGKPRWEIGPESTPVS